MSESFDEMVLDGHFRRLGSTLDAEDLPVIFTLTTGIEIVCEALGWREPSIWADLEGDLDE